MSAVTRTVVLGDPPAPLAEWLERRRQLGQDLFDEVWDGEYHVAPASHGRHGDVDDQIAVLLRPAARRCGLWPSSAVNIGDLTDYRVPDRAYFAERKPANFHPTAALVVEIVSPGDESYEKFDFYFRHDVAEVLIVDPQRHTVEWYRRGADGFDRTEASELLDITEVTLSQEIDWPPV
jgi:Uma2 family endonuclease